MARFRILGCTRGTRITSEAKGKKLLFAGYCKELKDPETGKITISRDVISNPRLKMGGTEEAESERRKPKNVSKGKIDPVKNADKGQAEYSREVANLQQNSQDGRLRHISNRDPGTVEDALHSKNL